MFRPDQIGSFLSAKPPAGMTTRIIAIDGGGGSGKSTLAKRLSVQLDNAYIVHTDDFASLENPLNWLPRLIEQVLELLSRNRLARYQRYDWGTKRLAEWLTFEPGGVVILEGVSSLRREFRPYLTFGIWVETPQELRLKRGLDRDGQYTQDQ